MKGVDDYESCRLLVTSTVEITRSIHLGNEGFICHIKCYLTAVSKLLKFSPKHYSLLSTDLFINFTFCHPFMKAEWFHDVLWFT